MLANLEGARSRYLEERHKYVKIAESVAQQFRFAATRSGLQCTVSCRAKDVASFVKKSISSKSTDPWSDIKDKAGVRIIVRHAGDLDVALALAGDLFGPPLWAADDRNDDGPEDRLRYPRLHLQIAAPPLRDGTPLPDPADCEIQIRTEASDLWSRMSHALLYKPETVLPKNVRRSLYRLLALVELYDQEVERAVAAIGESPDRQLSSFIAQTEMIFYTFCSTPYNLELTREIAEVILEAIPDDHRENYCSDLVGFSQLHRKRLEKLYRNYGPSSALGAQGAYILMSQPESVAIFERLQNAPMKFQRTWDRYIDNEDLFHEMKNIWG